MIFSHDFFTIGICYLQKSLYTDKLDIIYYIILEVGNDISFFHGLVTLQIYVILLFSLKYDDFWSRFFHHWYLLPQKSLYTDKLDIIYYTIFEVGNNISFFHRLVTLR